MPWKSEQIPNSIMLHLSARAFPLSYHFPFKPFFFAVFKDLDPTVFLLSWICNHTKIFLLRASPTCTQVKVSVGLHCNYCKLKNPTLQHPPELHDGRTWPVYAITFLSSWWSSTWEEAEPPLGLRLPLQSLHFQAFLWSGQKSSQSVLPSPGAKLSTEVIPFRCQQKLDSMEARQVMFLESTLLLVLSELYIQKLWGRFPGTFVLCLCIFSCLPALWNADTECWGQAGCSFSYCWH